VSPVEAGGGPVTAHQLWTLKRNKKRKQSCKKAWQPPIAGVSRTLTRASRLLRQKTATAAPLALSRN
jgi:hypothetical protein